MTVRNKEKSTHIKELQDSRGGNLHIIEADVVDQPAMQVVYITYSQLMSRVDTVAHFSSVQPRKLPKSLGAP